MEAASTEQHVQWTTIFPSVFRAWDLGAERGSAKPGGKCSPVDCILIEGGGIVCCGNRTRRFPDPPPPPISGIVTCVIKEMVTAETAYQSPARFR